MVSKMDTPYGGRVFKLGCRDDPVAICAIQDRLSELKCGKIVNNGIFDVETFKAVRAFQTRFPDSYGNELSVDGTVGALTWDALFNMNVELPLKETCKFNKAILKAAQEQLFQFDGRRYLDYLGVDEDVPWGVAFTYFCSLKAQMTTNIVTTHLKTPSAVLLWRDAVKNGRSITLASIASDSRVIEPGMIYVSIIADEQYGHAGVVEAVFGSIFYTIEGNTNVGFHRDAVGVYRRCRRLNLMNTGFIKLG